MNKKKTSNPVRLIAFFLTAFLLVCTFGFTVDGWQIGEDSDSKGTSALPSDPSSNNRNEGDNQNSDNSNKVPDSTGQYIPEYINRITGVEVSKEISNRAHLAFVMNPILPSYGISCADLICEIPTEEGGERMIAFLPDSKNLWKIGSLTYTRGYITNIVKYFGGLCVSGGNDDTINYNHCEPAGMYLDLSLNEKYHYTEFTSNVYTNSDLLSLGINNSGLDPTSIASPQLPYDFPDYGDEEIFFNESAVKVKIEPSPGTLNELFYNEDTGKYFLSKNGTALSDAMNGKQLEFENCFILFADCLTYDNTKCSQMVMDTIGCGVGYYFTNGSVCKIKWTGTSEGVLSFTSQDGERLTINRGSVYISFLKSSMTDKITFE